MELLLASGCPECSTSLARAWLMGSDAFPMIVLAMLPLGLTLGAAALVYGLFGEEQ